jgi:hypothetical protein
MTLPERPLRRPLSDHRSRILSLAMIVMGSAATILGLLLPWVRDRAGITYGLAEGYPGSTKLEVWGEIVVVLAVPIVALVAALIHARGGQLGAAALVAVGASAMLSLVGNILVYGFSAFVTPQEGFWLVIAGRALIAAPAIFAFRGIHAAAVRSEPRPDLEV